MSNTQGVIDAMRQMGAGDIANVMDALFNQMTWAEEEITAGKSRHPEAAEEIGNSFLLLRGTCDLMRIELVYRAHCRELLDRVAAGADTRPATDAEIAAGLSEASLVAPLDEASTTLYMRLFRRAFPDEADQAVTADFLDAHERVAGHGADDLERKLRKVATADWRTPKGVAS